MKKETKAQIIIAGIFACVTLSLFFANVFFEIEKGFWKASVIDILDIIMVLVLSYFFIQWKSDRHRKIEKLDESLKAIQNKVSDERLIDISSDSSKKITRIKLRSISNYLEYIRNNIDEALKEDVNVIIQYSDNLCQMILDHIEDEIYIEKSTADIVRLTTTVFDLIEKLRFNLYL